MLDFALSLLALPIFSDKVPLCTSGGFRWRAFNTFCWGEVSMNLWSRHHHQFYEKTLEVMHLLMVSMEKNSPKMSWIKRLLSWSSVETSTRRWSLKSWARTVILPSLYSPACNIWTTEWQTSVFDDWTFQWPDLIHFNLDWSNDKLSLTFDNYLQITLLLDPFPVVAADQVSRVRCIEL